MKWKETSRPCYDGPEVQRWVLQASNISTMSSTNVGQASIHRGLSRTRIPRSSFSQLYPSPEFAATRHDETRNICRRLYAAKWIPSKSCGELLAGLGRSWHGGNGHLRHVRMTIPPSKHLGLLPFILVPGMPRVECIPAQAHRPLDSPPVITSLPRLTRAACYYRFSPLGMHCLFTIAFVILGMYTRYWLK